MREDSDEVLRDRVKRQAHRIGRAQREHETLLAQTAYLGVLGLVFVMPIVAGAYLGRWLDGMMEGYSMGWTLSLLFVGLVVGGVNVWLMIRE